MQAILGEIDRFYVEDIQKTQVQTALTKSLSNNIDLLTKYCDPAFVEKIGKVKGEKELNAFGEEYKKHFMAFNSSIQKFLYIDSGYVRDGAGNQVRQKALEWMQDMGERSETMKLAGQVIGWTMAIGMAGWVLSKPYPGVGALARAALKNPFAAGGAAGAMAIMASYFGYEAYAEIEDEYWGKPAHVKALKKVFESQFQGFLPLVRNEDVAMQRDDERTQTAWNKTLYYRPAKNLYKAWMIGITLTMLSPVMRAAAGGTRGVWSRITNPFRYKNVEFVKRELLIEAESMGLDTTALKEMDVSQIQHAVAQAKEMQIRIAFGDLKGKVSTDTLANTQPAVAGEFIPPPKKFNAFNQAVEAGG
jgi:hypothetical protein